MNAKVHRIPSVRIRPWLSLIALLIVGSGLGFYKLDSKSLWFDEVTTVQISQGNWPDMLESLNHQHNAPPLYYLILHLFTYLGVSEFMMRLPSVLFGILALAATFSLASLLFDKNVGFLATLLLALSPLHLQYTQEARMYTLFVTLAILSLFFFLRAVRTGNKRFWVAYALVTTASAYTHYFTMFYVAVQAVFLAIISATRFLEARRKGSVNQVGTGTWLGFVFSMLSLLVLYLPWLPSVLTRTHGTGFQQNLSDILTQTFLGLGGGQMTALPYVLGGLFLWGLIAGWLTNHGEQALLVGIWVVLPPLMTYLFLSYSQSFFATRYLIFILPLYHIGIAYGLTYLLRRLAHMFRRPALPLALGSTILALAIVAVSVAPIQAMYSRPKQPCRELAAFFESETAPGEVVLVEPRGAEKCLAFYGMEFAQSAGGSLTRFQEIASTATGVWYLRWSNQFVDPTGAIQRWIVENKFVKLMRGTAESGGLILYYKSFDSAQPRDMLPVLEFFAELDPGFPGIYFPIGVEYQNRGDLEQALSAFQHWSELEPDRAEAVGLVAWTLHKLKRFEEAASAFNRALELKQIASSYRGLGDSYFQLRKYEQALAAFERWAEMEPDRAAAYNSVGWTYLLLQDCPNATQSFEKALELDPGLSQAQDGLTKCQGK